MKKMIFAILCFWAFCCAAPNANAEASKFYTTNYNCIVFFEGNVQITVPLEVNTVTNSTKHAEIMQARVRLPKAYRGTDKGFYHYFSIKRASNGQVDVVLPPNHQKERMTVGGTRRMVKLIFLSSHAINFDLLKRAWE